MVPMMRNEKQIIGGTESVISTETMWIPIIVKPVSHNLADGVGMI